MSDECPISCACPRWDYAHRLKLMELRLKEAEAILGSVADYCGCGHYGDGGEHESWCNHYWSEPERARAYFSKMKDSV